MALAQLLKTSFRANRLRRAALGLLLATTLSVTVTAAPEPDAVVPLFNGKDLSGWYSWLVDSRRLDHRNVFSVTNGQIRISGDGLGYLATAAEYVNYRLRIEWRWGEVNTHWGDRVGRARDSGIFLHATGPDGNSEDGGGAFMAALECNLFQGATGDLLLIRGRDEQGQLIAPRATAEVAEGRDVENWFTWQRGGRLVTLDRWGRVNWSGKATNWQDRLDFRGPRDLEKPAGEWNTVECIARGDTLQFVVNGVLVNEALRVWPSRGKILLQCEGSEIFFRKVELIHLTP
jgi:hypothetical protein